MGGKFLRAAVAAVVATMAVLATGSAPALAHNSFTGSVPADGARLDRAPASVRLSFLAKVDPATTRITLTGPDGTSAAAGRPVFAGNKVTVPLRAGLAGGYLVAYRVASDDGHPIEGGVRFTIGTVLATPTPGISAPNPSNTAAVDGEPAAPAPPAIPPTEPEQKPASALAVPQDSAATDDLPWWPLVLAAAIAGVFGAVALARRRGARRDVPRRA